MKRPVLPRDQRISLSVWLLLATLYLTYKEIAAFYYPNSNIVFEYVANSPTPNKDSSLQAIDQHSLAAVSAPVELNKADSNELTKLKIPGYLISKILLYREQLGGFVNVFQLLEIYHFPEPIFERIHPLLRLDTSTVKPIGINSKTEEELALHPYLNFKEAKAIVSFRKNNGQINDMNDFEKIIAVQLETKEKLKPYLAKDFQSYANTSGKSP